jgi:ketosteroid isomerase-like protein
MLGRNLIAASLDVKQHTEGKPVLKAICGAIARHHAAQASNFGIAQLDSSAKQAIEEALRFAQQNQQWSYDLSQLNLHISEGGDLAPESALTPKLTRPASGPQSELETWLYFLIVRALRLADQRAGIFS